jgi:hypothetical protein
MSPQPADSKPQSPSDHSDHQGQGSSLATEAASALEAAGQARRDPIEAEFHPERAPAAATSDQSSNPRYDFNEGGNAGQATTAANV